MPGLSLPSALSGATQPRAGARFPDNFVFRVFVLALALAAATLLRALLGPVVPGVPFAFYYPAIIIVALACGWEFGAGAILISLLLAWYLFVPPVLHWRMPSPTQRISLGAMAAVGAMLVAISESLRRALARARASEVRYRELMEVTSGIVCITDAAGRISEPQHGWTEITGMPWPEYRDLGWLKAVHKDDQHLVAGDRPVNAEGIQYADIRIWSRSANDWRWFGMRAVPLLKRGGRIEGWMSALTDMHEHKLVRERQELMLGEHRHRLKNLITVIDSLANWSNPQGDKNVEAFLKKFTGRLRALGGVSDQIIAADWKELEAENVIRTALAPFMEEGSARFSISGPPLSLSEQTAGSLALAMHELATNALKYGALSAKDGRVSVTWSRTPAPFGERVVLAWREEGGPPAAQPQREGFGLRLIRFVPAREKDGAVRFEFAPEGFRCEIGFTRP